jgi:hypothetical protein
MINCPSSTNQELGLDAGTPDTACTLKLHQEGCADGHVMSSAGKSVDALQLQLNSMHDNKTTTPYGTLKQALYKVPIGNSLCIHHRIAVDIYSPSVYFYKTFSLNCKHTPN